MQSGREQIDALLNLNGPPTAVFCYRDRMKLGAYDAIEERGLKVPADISVVGFDNEVFAKDIDPPSITINLPHEAMGKWAVSALLDGAVSPTGTGKHRR